MDQERSQGIAFTITLAAAECGVHRNTIKRKLTAGEFPNAAQTDGKWLIPLADLLAANLHPGRPTPGADETLLGDESESLAVLRERVDGLHNQLDERSARIEDLKALNQVRQDQLETNAKQVLAIEGDLTTFRHQRSEEIVDLRRQAQSWKTQATKNSDKAESWKVNTFGVGALALMALFVITFLLLTR